MPDDYSADRFTTGAVAVGGSTTGTIETAYDEDWFAVELVAGRTYRFDLEGSPTGRGTLPDTYLRAIYDSEGRYQSRTYNDNFDGSKNSRVTFTAQESGTYYVRASGDRDEVGHYTLSVRDVTPPEADDPPPADPAAVVAESETETDQGQAEPVSVSEGATDLPNDNSTLGRVAVGGSATGTIGRARDNDRFAVELEAGRTYQFDLEGSPGGGGTLPDTYFRAIYNSEGRYQSRSYNDDFDCSRDSRVTFTPTESGTHYARVSGDRDEVGSYTLRVTDVTPQEAEAGQVETVFVPGESETEPATAPGRATPPGPGKRANVSEPDGEDLPDDTTTTGEVDVGGSVTGNINPAGDEDYFHVYLYGGRNYQIDVEGADTNKGTLEDPWLVGIYNADDEEIPDTFSSDGRLTFKPTATRTYYMRVGAEGDPDTGTYTLSVREVPPTRFEEEEGFNRINDMPTDYSTRGWVDVDRFGARGTIGVSGDIDWFRVVLEAGRTYRIDMKGAIFTGPGTYADDELTLRLPEIVAIYDEDSTYLHHTSSRYATDDANRPHHLARVEFTPGADGTYYIAATGVSVETGGYELTVIDITDDPDEHTANRHTGGTVDVGGSIQGKIDFSGDRDWFAVELEADTEYTFNLEGQATGRGSLRDPSLDGIFDNEGNEITGTRDDDGGEGNNARVTFTPEEAGTYYVAAAAFGYLEGTYALSADVSDGM